MLVAFASILRRMAVYISNRCRPKYTIAHLLQIVVVSVKPCGSDLSRQARLRYTRPAGFIKNVAPSTASHKGFFACWFW